jgi:hypothetical protein
MTTKPAARPKAIDVSFTDFLNAAALASACTMRFGSGSTDVSAESTSER